MDWSAVIAGGLVAGTGLLIRLLVQVTRIQSVVERELSVNSGHSLRDRVVRIEAQLHAHLLNNDPTAIVKTDE